MEADMAQQGILTHNLCKYRMLKGRGCVKRINHAKAQDFSVSRLMLDASENT